MKTVSATDTSAKPTRASATAVKRVVRRKSKNEAAAAANTEAEPVLAAEQRYQMIAAAAYFRAERRGFAAGSELQDWLEAEAEIDRMFAAPSEMSGKTGSKRAFQQRLEAQIKEWDEKFDDLVEKATKTKDEVRQEFEEQLDALRARRAAAQEKLRELRRRTGSAWEDLKDGVEKAWDEMRKAMDGIGSRFK